MEEQSPDYLIGIELLPCPLLPEEKPTLIGGRHQYDGSPYWYVEAGTGTADAFRIRGPSATTSLAAARLWNERMHAMAVQTSAQRESEEAVRERVWARLKAYEEVGRSAKIFGFPVTKMRTEMLFATIGYFLIRNRQHVEQLLAKE